MVIVTWNSHHGGVGSDGKLDVVRFARAMVALKADVYCLNEVEIFHGYGDSDQVAIYREVLSEVGEAWTSHVVGIDGRVNVKGQQANVILSKLPIMNPGQKALQGARSVAYARIGGVSVYATHLDNDSSLERNVQATQQLCWHRDQPDPRIICGDFNCQPSATELAPWHVWYTDAWANGKKIGFARAFNTTGNTRNSRIDYVFFRGLKLIKVEVPDTRVSGVFPSDHHPVVATFT
jgi:endonuclease/exonuclease/phosphatase family metal-dependent hydrolase